MSLKDQIKSECLKNPAEESCGLVLFGNEETFIYPCQNLSKIKKHHFSINPSDYIQAASLGKIIGCYHSHVNDIKEFSILDKINAYNQKLVYYMYHVGSDVFVELRPEHCFSFLNKPFQYGMNDCWTLTREYFLNELKIKLPEVNYNELSVKWKDDEAIRKDFEYNGFNFISNNEDMCANDVLLFNFYDTIFPPHFAVYLGNGFILHHPRKSFSKLESLTDSYKRRLKFIWRHKDV